jgi:CubicO group peptidase (beta-lactamase class C family)
VKGEGGRGEYQGVTLAQLLRNRGGIDRLQSPDPEMEQRFDTLSGSPAERTTALVTWMLARPPAAPIGRFAYSNGGYVLAGELGARASGLDFAGVMASGLFDPLGLRTATIAPSRRPDELRGHLVTEGHVVPVPADDNPYQLPDEIAPAGAVRLSLGDLGVYLRLHLGGLRGRDGALRAATVRELHRAEPGPDKPNDLFGAPVGYAAGWVAYHTPGLGRVSWHNGSAGSFFAWVAILPDRDLAIAVVTNVGGREPGEAACRELTRRVLERLGLASGHPTP